jgi:16S rRNA (guanine(1405)-N(7))-methyltransferase
MPPLDPLEELITAVRRGARYASISSDLVRRIGAQELEKRRSLKEAVKATRSKLHQVGGAYQQDTLSYPSWLERLTTLKKDTANPDLMAFCRQVMLHHASTRERLPYLESFYARTLTSLAPIRSVLDLGCGLNPLAIGWMALSPTAPYYACDIYEDLVFFLNAFLTHTGRSGHVEICDLAQGCPQKPVHLALLLKTLSCLEQQDRSIALRLLKTIPAEHILVTFPAHSLGGRSKGMLQNYETHFNDLISGQDWHIQRFDFPSELAFLITQ